MRIIQLIQKPQLRGAELFASQLSNHLIALGHEVKMVCLIDGSAELPFKGELINLKRPLSRRLIDVIGWKQLAHIIAEFKPDIIQANAGDTLKFSALSKWVFRWKTPLVFRNANKVSDFIDSWPKLKVNKFFVSQVTHVISVSELCRADFVATYLFPDKKTITIPIGIELDRVENNVPVDLQHLFVERKIILNVASLVPEKNHAALIRITKKLVEQGKNINMLIVGDGRLKGELQEKVKAAGLTDRFFLLGYRNDVMSIMANAHVFALPSLIEGLPGVILESFYCRLPVVANNVGGISEVVIPNETGYLIKRDDEESFTQAIASLLEDETSNSKIREHALERVTTDFTNKKIAEKFSIVYQQMR